MHLNFQVNDPTCISRLTAFSDDAERLMTALVPTHVLKISNLRFLVIEKQYKGACTSPLEFRADRQTTVNRGDELEETADAIAAPPPSLEIPPNTPKYFSIYNLFSFTFSTTIADVLDRKVTDGEFQLMASVKTVSAFFPGKRMLNGVNIVFILQVANVSSLSNKETALLRSPCGTALRSTRTTVSRGTWRRSVLSGL